MESIENDFLKICVKSKGAELASIFNKNISVELLWQADPEIWPWHAPNLFPVVGGCINNQILINKKSYKMLRHGFARNTEFLLIDRGPSYLKFALSDEIENLRNYPFKYSFQIIYELVDRAIRIIFKVINYDEQPVYFSVGAHPAFNVPFFADENLEAYFLEFEKDEPLIRDCLSTDGFFNGKTGEVNRAENRLSLTADMFANDALVFKNLKSRKVSLKSKLHNHRISISYPNFNYLGIWAKPGAPFICLEPWIGCADTEGPGVELSEKEGIKKLDPGHVFEVDFKIEVH